MDEEGERRVKTEAEKELSLEAQRIVERFQNATGRTVLCIRDVSAGANDSRSIKLSLVLKN